MKKQTIIAIVAILVIAIIIGGVIAVNNNNSGNKDSVKIESAKDMKKMFSTINSNLKEELPSLETQEIDVSDEMQVEAYTGLKSNENVEALVVSEPMMSSQAYSAVAVKVKSNADIETLKQEMLDNIDTSKWICASASKVYVTNHDNVIFLVMADEEWAKPVYDEFKKFVNNNIGKELEKNAEEDFELPPQMIVQ